MCNTPQRQAGVEITDEMIEAGVAAYANARPCEASDFNERGVAEAIYDAMSRARCVSSCEDQTRVQ